MNVASGQPSYKDPGAGASGNSERTLIYIPVIHTQVDLGALNDRIQLLKIGQLGRGRWRRNLTLVDKLWSRIESTITGLSLPYERLRVYQDGLPVCGREAEIVSRLAAAGSRNYRLLLVLKEKGATIMGTESPELLLEEYQLVKEDFGSVGEGSALPRAARGRPYLSGRPQAAAKQEVTRRALSDSLLKRRDQYIANRINQTLLAGETGILFLGGFHSVENGLDKDIRVVRPIPPILTNLDAKP
jgi:hypothetical protein